MQGRTQRRPVGALVLAGLAAACAPPQQSSDRSACAPLFQDYDRFAQFRPIETVNRRGEGEILDPVLSRLTTLLIQNDCQTRARDLGALEAVAQAHAGQRIVERGAALGRPVAIHVGALTGEAEAARAVAFFQGLGIRATSIGNRQLGRRVYVGPVTTEGALGEVIAIAFEAGFVAPYPSQFFRF